MKALIYARQSSGKEDVSESVEAQIANCLSIAANQEMEVLGIFRDLNSSGELYPQGAEEIAKLDAAYQEWISGQTTRKTCRPGLGELLKKLPEADVLLVNEMTRLYRPVNESFLEGYLHNKLRVNGVKVVQYQGETIDLSKFDQQLVLALKNQILYEDLRKKRQNSINAFRIKRDSGKLCSGSRIFGIKYHGKDKISVDPEKRKIVRMIYDGILSGDPLNTIVRRCNSAAGRMIMYPSLLASIARQPLYAGYQYNTEGILIRNTQISGQEFISMAEWNRVREIFEEKRGKSLSSGKKHWLPMSGRLFCGVCGGRLVCRIDHGKVSYTCNKQKYDISHRQCAQSRIRFEPGSNRLPALYDAMIPLLALGIVKLYRESREWLSESRSCREREFSLAALKNREQDILELFLDGLITKPEMREFMEKHQEKKEHLIREINALKFQTETVRNDCQPKLLLLQLRRIAAGKIDRENFERLMRKADITALVFRDSILFRTVFGEVRIPRIRLTAKVRMPAWRIGFRKKKNPAENDSLPEMKITYFTGKKHDLALLDSVKIVTK